MKKLFMPVLPVAFIVVIAFLFFRGTFSLHAASPSEKTIPLDPSLYPNLVTIDSLHHRAYIASHTSVDTIAMPITILDTLHDSLVGVLPASTLKALAVNGTTHRIYAVDSIANNLLVFDTDTNTQIGTISSLISSPVALAVNETTNRIYVLSNQTTGAVQTGMLTVLDGEKGNVLASAIPIGSNPVQLAINPLTNKIYVINASGLSVIDGVTNTVITSLPITAGLIDVAVDIVLNHIYITSSVGSAIFVVDGNRNTLITQIPITNSIDCAHTMSVDSSSHKLYAACFTGMTVIDTKTNVIIQQMPLTGELPITHAITSQYLGMDAVLNKIYVPLEETHQIAVVALSDPPKIDPITPITGNEGSKITLPLSFTDTNAFSWTVTADFGDGTTAQTHSLTATTDAFQHVYVDNGIYTITLTLTNAIGATSSVTTTATIQNVSPTVGLITASNTIVSLNTPITFTVPFTDPGSKDSHTAVWNFGDGTISAGNMSGTYTSGFSNTNHAYKTPGVYTVSVTIIDKDDSGTTNKLQYIVVSDLSPQSIVGEGNIDSPLGSVKANPTLGGKMNIGFYVKNTPLAAGSVQYNFQLANLDFRATAVSSLTIHGTLVQVRGTGTVNNGGNYGFVLTMQDNQQLKTPDTIRIKIWDTTTGMSIYDTQMHDADSIAPTTVLQNGAVQIF